MCGSLRGGGGALVISGGALLRGGTFDGGGNGGAANWLPLGFCGGALIGGSFACSASVD